LSLSVLIEPLLFEKWADSEAQVERGHVCNARWAAPDGMVGRSSHFASALNSFAKSRARK
jgi:hypothetical protein